MSISDPFIRRPVLAVVANLVLAVLGLFALTKLPVRELPRFEVPVVTVATLYAGASAEQVERQLTTPLEQSLASVSGVDVMSSTSAPGMSSIQMTFTSDIDPGQAANEARAKAAAVADALPRDAGQPVVTQISADAMPVVYLSLKSATLSAMELTEVAKRIVRPRLSTLPGVADVQLLGERRYAVRIALDPILLAARDVTTAEVSAALQAQNLDVPSGEIVAAGRRIPVIAQTTVALPGEFADLVLRSGPEWALRLGDVGRTGLGPQNVDNGVLIDGKAALTLGALRQSGANEIDVARAVRTAMAGIQAGLPAGVEVSVAFDGSVYIARSVEGVWHAILQAVVLVTAVILLFLASFRAALVTLVTIPLSLVGTLAFLLMMGYSINTFTLLAMVLAVGLVVDDAIIDVENVQRHIRTGLGPIDAAFVGSREIGFAIVATTATVASVFAPIGLMPGMVGALFREFAFTLAAAVVISGYISRTLSPMLCSRLLLAREGLFARRAADAFDRFAGGYARLLAAALRLRWLVLALLAGILAVCGVLAARGLPTEIAPVEDAGYVLVRFQGLPGASYDTMETQARAVTDVFQAVPEHVGSLVLIGTPSRDEGFAMLMLRPWEERTRSAQVIGAAIGPALNRIPGAQADVVDSGVLSGGGMPPIQFVVRTAERYEQLGTVMEQLLSRARANPALTGVRSNLSLTVPRIDVEIDRAMAADHKVPLSAVGEALAALLGARYVSNFAWNGELYYVVLEFNKVSSGQVDALTELYVRSSDGHSVPLAALVRALPTVGPDALRHFNGLPSARITASPAPGGSVSGALDWLETQAREVLPPGFSYDFDGASRQLRQANVQVALVFALALVFIFLFLAAQFESFRDPAIVLAVVPFAVVGALVGLAAVGGSLNIYSGIGILALVGLVAKNGILITEFINQQRDHLGLGRQEAIVRGAATRLKPVLMTTAATILGAVPLVLDTGPGAVGRNQIGAIIVGGMAFGTVVSLVIVPILYSLLSRRRRKPLVVPPPMGAMASVGEALPVAPVATEAARDRLQTAESSSALAK